YPPLPPTTISTLSLHDALPISRIGRADMPVPRADSETRRIPRRNDCRACHNACGDPAMIRTRRWEPCVYHRGTHADSFLRDYLRSEEHTSELQSRENLVCRLLL